MILPNYIIRLCDPEWPDDVDGYYDAKNDIIGALKDNISSCRDENGKLQIIGDYYVAPTNPKDEARCRMVHQKTIQLAKEQFRTTA